MGWTISSGIAVQFTNGLTSDVNSGSLDRALLILIGVSIAATAVAFRLPETGSKAREKKKSPWLC